jgi:hypothetical protein
MPDYFEGGRGTPGWTNRVESFLQQELVVGIPGNKDKDIEKLAGQSKSNAA